MREEKEKNRMGYFFDLSEVARYYFRKKDPDKRNSINLRLMHGINKIALFMFLIAMLILIYKYIFVY
ncbi:MAG: hypothetical protein RIF46_14065 [Cyclobacteriaceae bacterium]